MLPGLLSCGSGEPRYSAAQAVDTEGRADWVYQQIWGDAEQKDAGEYLAHRALTEPIRACMADRDWDYPATFARLWAGYRSNGTSGGWLGHLEDPPSRTELAQAAARRLETEPPANPELEKPGYRADLAECETRAGDPDAVAAPSGTEALSAEFTRLMSSVEADLGSTEPYTECMAEAGFELSDDLGEGQAGLYGYLMSRMPTPPLPREEPSAEWQDYLELEATALRVDASCREDKRLEGLELLEPRLRDFTREHADALLASEQAWARLLEQARAAGYQV